MEYNGTRFESRGWAFTYHNRRGINGKRGRKQPRTTFISRQATKSQRGVIKKSGRIMEEVKTDFKGWISKKNLEKQLTCWA